MNRRCFGIVAGALTAYLITGCQTAPPPATDEDTTAAAPSKPVELTVSVAASVQDAMKEVQQAYQEEAPNVTITYNFGSSGSLAQQIAQGAPVDVFLSASPEWVDRLEEGQLLEGTPQELLQNSLVLIVPQPAEIDDFAELDTDEVSKIAIGEPESVPAGRYAKEALTAMNLFDALQPKLVFSKDVRQVVSYVETGNVDAGLVYATDALGFEQVQAIATAPAQTHSPIIYPVAVINDSDSTAAAQAFVDFLFTDTAVEIFEDHGFTMVE